MIWTERAEADLDEIWRFSEQRWGEEQADLYIIGLQTAIADRRLRKMRARPIDFVKSGWLRMRHIRHFIYFRFDGEDVFVMRVLHDSMDETLHIP